MSQLVEDLKAARECFHSYRCGIETAARSTLATSKHGLEALVLLRESLPDGYADFRQYESSRQYSRREGYRTFDRAIAKAGEAS